MAENKEVGMKEIDRLIEAMKVTQYINNNKEKRVKIDMSLQDFKSMILGISWSAAISEIVEREYFAQYNVNLKEGD